MVRVDATNELLRQEIRQEVRAEMMQKEKARRRRHCLGCLTIYAIVLGVPLIFGLITVSRTGFFEIPLLTKWLYKPVKAERTIAPLMGRGSEIIWKEVSAASTYNMTTGQSEMYISETELTTIIAESLADTEGLPFEVEKPQVAILRDHLEFYFVIPRGDREVPVLIEIKPKVRDGKLVFDTDRMVLGGAEMPSFASDMFSKLVNRILGQSFSGNLPDSIVLRKVEATTDKRLKIVVGILG